MNIKLGMITVVALLGLATVGGCDDNNISGNMDMSSVDRTITGDGGGNDLGGSSCSTNPMTNEEMINACTTADSVDITPFYPTKAPGGVLPNPI